MVIDCNKYRDKINDILALHDRGLSPQVISASLLIPLIAIYTMIMGARDVNRDKFNEEIKKLIDFYSVESIIDLEREIS